MKRNIRIFGIIFIIFTAMIIFSGKTSAVNANWDDNVLVKSSLITITKQTKVADITKVFGNPTLVTNSCFGGKMNSWYNEAKKAYVYAETDSAGTIKQVCYISYNFQSKYHNAMDTENYDTTTGMTYIKDYIDKKTVYIGVNIDNYAYNERTPYIEKYMANQSENLYNLQKHAIYSSKMCEYLAGKEFKQNVVSEDLFYLNELMKSNKTTLYDTLYNNGLSKFVSTTGGQGFRESDYTMMLPCNPGYLGAGHTSMYTMPGADYKYFVYDIGNTKLDNGKTYGGFNGYAINPDFMLNRTTVELTSEEKTKLTNVEKYYKEFLSYVEKTNYKYFEVEPDVKTLSTTKQYGKMKEDAIKAAVAYINMGRAGIGMPPLVYDESLSNAAQIKAVAVEYLNNVEKQGVSHYFSKPSWMSDSDYAKAMSGAENLYMGSMLGGNIFGSIEYALNDTWGDSSTAITCGHRYNLLNPTSYVAGFGFATAQGCHKFSGYQASSVDLVAWPSNGIMPMQLIANGGIGNWTAQFQNGKYQVTSDTTVKIKNLNNGVTYNITGSEQGKFLKINNSSFITFRDDSVTYQDGDVLEVTLTNVKYSDGTTKDYKYRIVFKSFVSNSTQAATSISTLDNATTVQVGVGKTRDLKVRIKPDNASNKLTYISSADSSIASVRADGVITGKKIGNTVVTIKCGNIVKKINIQVLDKVNIPITSVTLNQTSATVAARNTLQLKATVNPEDTTENKTVTWSSNNTKIATVDSNGLVTAVANGTATITAKAGSKTATCAITVTGSKITTVGLNATSLSLAEGGTYKLNVSYVLPYYATEDKTPTWTSSNTSVATVDKDGNVKGIKEGTATITCKVGSASTTCKVTVAYKLPFTDVPIGSWYYDAVKYSYTKGIIKGYTNTRFAPDDKLTRGQLVTILYRLEGEPSVSNVSSSFTDIGKSEYYTNAVKWANSKGIVTGYSAKSFGPGDNITRQDLAVILNRYAKYKGKKATTTANLNAFKDKNAVESYAQTAVKWAVENGIISGNPQSDGSKTIAPVNNATRAEVATMLQRYMNKFN